MAKAEAEGKPRQNHKVKYKYYNKTKYFIEQDKQLYGERRFMYSSSEELSVAYGSSLSFARKKVLDSFGCLQEGPRHGG